jgi:hypothetical protein
MKETGQLHAPAALPQGKWSQYPLYWRLAEPHGRSGCCGEVKILYCRESNPGHPARSPSLYRLSYPDPYNEAVRQIFVDFKKVYDSVVREVLHNILIEFGVPMKLVRLNKMRFNETYIKSVYVKLYLTISLSKIV